MSSLENSEENTIDFIDDFDTDDGINETKADVNYTDKNEFDTVHDSNISQNEDLDYHNDFEESDNKETLPHLESSPVEQTFIESNEESTDVTNSSTIKDDIQHNFQPNETPSVLEVKKPRISTISNANSLLHNNRSSQLKVKPTSKKSGTLKSISKTLALEVEVLKENEKVCLNTIKEMKLEESLIAKNLSDIRKRENLIGDKKTKRLLNKQAEAYQFLVHKLEEEIVRLSGFKQKGRDKRHKFPLEQKYDFINDNRLSSSTKVKSLANLEKALSTKSGSFNTRKSGELNFLKNPTVFDNDETTFMGDPVSLIKD
ncbi:hypothetical protein HK099_008670 [Clydaea vesicula]|uniref:Uncharacterized protein n=1 Tax=Clydaea vesicula TaxID=447962 RepID=A0AAD5XT17_9FUNG|nr:hypothetical protein HK099_008670 [Clydaea vesicula]